MAKKKELKSEEIKVPEAKVVKGEVHVFSASGEFVRSYSLKDHGPDFDAKAKEFSKKIGGHYEYPIEVK